jgi:hypothetical protein
MGASIAGNVSVSEKPPGSVQDAIAAKALATATAERLEEAVAAMQPEDRQTIYAHLVKVTELYMDWRHRVMAFTFTVTAGLLAISAWMYNHDLRRAIAGPLILGALLALASAVFDGRNQRILCGCYELADALEQKFGLPCALGPLGRIPIVKGAPWWKRLNTYHAVLRFAYLLLFTLLVAAAAHVLASPPSPR